jgi:dihydropteroate synthase-like protein
MADLSGHEVLIFAEIVDAPHLALEGILAQARAYRADGADIIDLGTLPETPFPHLEDAIRVLKTEGLAVSVDSMDSHELLRAGRAGADYLLSLNEDTLWITDQVSARPVLVPLQPGDLESLMRAVHGMQARGREFFADPILDPIHFGFVASLGRYAQLRRLLPEVPMMMGIGNVTELTDADTVGMNALLLGMISELQIAALLTTQVSPHARSVVREIDRGRRMMYAARQANSLPRDFSDELLVLHARRPFPDTSEEIEQTARLVKDPSFRIQVSEHGIHVYNRAGHHRATDPFALWPNLGLEADAAHAYYMGVELARAQIAWQLGKRYAQDEPLRWGAAQPAVEEDRTRQSTPGTTLSHSVRGHKG